jgi:hypothetical protein
MSPDGDKKQKQPEVGLTIRFPLAMYERLKELADEEYRSINNQVVFAVQQQLEAKGIEWRSYVVVTDDNQQGAT